MAGCKAMTHAEVANPLLVLKALSQHLWRDKLLRTLLREGGLQRLINEDGVDGVTSNPPIFEKAIAGSAYYRKDLERLCGAALDCRPSRRASRHLAADPALGQHRQQKSGVQRCAVRRTADVKVCNS